MLRIPNKLKFVALLLIAALLVQTMPVYAQSATPPPFPDPVAISISTASGSTVEGGVVQLTITATGPVALQAVLLPVTVTCTQNGVAVPIPDQTITILAGQSQGSVNVQVTVPNDNLVETPAPLLFSVPEQHGYAVPADTLTVTVQDNDNGEYTLTIRPGWNLVSLPVKPLDPAAVWTQLTTATGTVTIWKYEGGYTWWAKAGYEQGGLTMLPGEGFGFWVFSNAPANYNIIVAYNLASPDYTPRTLTSGWNLVACPLTGGSLTGLCGLAGGPGKVVFQYNSGYTFYTAPGSGYREGTLTSVTPGLGYWVLV